MEYPAEPAYPSYRSKFPALDGSMSEEFEPVLPEYKRIRPTPLVAELANQLG